MAAKKKLKASKKKAEKKAKHRVKAGIKASATLKNKTARATAGRAPGATAGKAAGTDPKRVAAILAKLDEAYPEASCELQHENAFQLLVSTILSAQCTDVRVNQVTQELFKKYTTTSSVCLCHASRVGAGNPPDRILSQQNKIGDGCEQGNRGKVWR